MRRYLDVHFDSHRMDLWYLAVKLFLSEESPSQVGVGGQDHLQAKSPWPWPSVGAGSDDNLPPGFEGSQPSNPFQSKLSQIPVIQWKCPARLAYVLLNTNLKAYDSVPRELIWKTLSDKGTPTRYIKVIQDMYEGARTCVRTPTGNTEYFPVDVGLNGRLEQWRNALEDKGLRVSREKTREKTEYMRCNFNRNDNDQNEEIRIVGWLKWREATGILCDKKVPLKLKGKFYRMAIRPAMLYMSECWPLTKVQANRMEVAEMRMLRWTCGKTIFDMIPNGVFRTNLQVVTIVNKIREGRLRWFGHVKRRPQ
ncbi:hypothetical protein Tco_0542565 [Tanacetum coccineum]